MNVSASLQAYADEQLQDRELNRLSLLEELEASDDPEFEARFGKFARSPVRTEDYRSFDLTIWSPAPFVLVVDEHRSLAPLVAYRHHTIELWCFADSLPIWFLDLWVS